MSSRLIDGGRTCLESATLSSVFRQIALERLFNIAYDNHP